MNSQLEGNSISLEELYNNKLFTLEQKLDSVYSSHVKLVETKAATMVTSFEAHLSITQAELSDATKRIAELETQQLELTAPHTIDGELSVLNIDETASHISSTNTSHLNEADFPPLGKKREPIEIGQKTTSKSASKVRDTNAAKPKLKLRQLKKNTNTESKPQSSQSRQQRQLSIVASSYAQIVKDTAEPEHTSKQKKPEAPPNRPFSLDEEANLSSEDRRIIIIRDSKMTYPHSKANNEIAGAINRALAALGVPFFARIYQVYRNGDRSISLIIPENFRKGAPQQVPRLYRQCCTNRR